MRAHFLLGNADIESKVPLLRVAGQAAFSVVTLVEKNSVLLSWQFSGSAVKIVALGQFSS